MTKFPTCKVHPDCLNVVVMRTDSCLEHTTVYSVNREHVPGPPAAPIPVASVADVVTVSAAALGPSEPDVIDVAYHQLGVKPLPAVFGPGPGVVATIATDTAPLAELTPALPSHRGWLARWLRNPS